MGQWLAKNNIFLTVAIASIAVFSFPLDSRAAPTSASGSASATIIGHVENFQIDTLLDFGAVQLFELNKRTLSSGGTVTVTPANERTAVGLRVEGHFSRGKINVRAAPGTHYRIVDLKAITVGPGIHIAEIIDLNTVSENNPAGGSMQGITGPDGRDNLFIGGTLALLSTAQNGRYRAEIEITIVF